eukprot:1194591-Prorocentrum_minimum.AAC.5
MVVRRCKARKNDVIHRLLDHENLGYTLTCTSSNVGQRTPTTQPQICREEGILSRRTHQMQEARVNSQCEPIRHRKPYGRARNPPKPKFAGLKSLDCLPA